MFLKNKLNMNTRRSPHYLPATLALSLAVVSSWSCAQQSSYPTRPIRIIVGFLPGSSNDTLAPRAIASNSHQAKQLLTIIVAG